MQIENREIAAKRVLKKLIKLHYHAHSGHIASALSCLNIIFLLFSEILTKDDRFILSKGHGVTALYVVLNELGLLSDKQLATYYQDGTFLGAHLTSQVAQISSQCVFGSGSLGHGLSLAAGIALAKKLKQQDGLVYTLLSDGDCNEGSTWEAAAFIAQHCLNNIITIIDANKLQGFGHTDEVLTQRRLAEKWQAFGFEVIEIINGNNMVEISDAMSKIASRREKPLLFLAHTIKGAGISFMENKLEWHYLPMGPNDYQQALAEIDKNA